MVQSFDKSAIIHSSHSHIVTMEWLNCQIFTLNPCYSKAVMNVTFTPSHELNFTPNSFQPL